MPVSREWTPVGRTRPAGRTRARRTPQTVPAYLYLRVLVLSQYEAIGATRPLVGRHGRKPARRDQLVKQGIEVPRRGIPAELLKLRPPDDPVAWLGEDVDDDRLGAERHLIVVQHLAKELRLELEKGY
jgi:hypothetical protein